MQQDGCKMLVMNIKIGVSNANRKGKDLLPNFHCRPIYVTKFVKRGLIHASNFSILEACNLPHV